MNGYIAQRRSRFYVVIYEGRDPVTGKEQRRWHPAGTNRAEAERLMRKLAAKVTRRVEAVRSLTFGAYLTSTCLPAKARKSDVLGKSVSVRVELGGRRILIKKNI